MIDVLLAPLVRQVMHHPRYEVDSRSLTLRLLFEEVLLLE